MILIFDGAFLFYAIFIISILVGGGLTAIVEYFSEHTAKIVLICLALLIIYIVLIFILTKIGDIEGSVIGNTLSAFFAGSQLVFFATYTLYRVAIYANSHPIAGAVAAGVYLLFLLMDLCLLSLSTFDYEEFDSYVGCTVLLGIGGWAVNLFIYFH